MEELIMREIYVNRHLNQEAENNLSMETIHNSYLGWTSEECFVKSSIYIQSNVILKALTGSGKTTALLKYIKEVQQQSIIVAPLIALGEQIAEGTDFKIVNSKNNTKSIKEDLKENLENGKTVVITLQSLVNNYELLKDYPIYIDEAHLLIEYSEYMGLYFLIYLINKGHFKNITMITATPMGLDLLFPKLKVVDAKVKSRYSRNVDLWEGQLSIANILGFILHMYKEKRAEKLVVLLQDKKVINALKSELEIRKISTAIYTADNRETTVCNEKFSKDVDIVLCTSSLTTGVSIKENFHSIYVMQHHDSINTIPQFFARNRNINSYCSILKGSYNEKMLPKKLGFDYISNKNFFGKTKVNKRLEDYLNETLNRLKYNINIKSLEYYLGKEEYSFCQRIEVADFSDTKLQSSATFLEKIDDPRTYFINNEIPNFRERDCSNLARLYKLRALSNFESIKSSEEEREVYHDLIKEYPAYVRGDRDKFYDLFIDKMKDVKKLESLKLVGKVT